MTKSQAVEVRTEEAGRVLPSPAKPPQQTKASELIANHLRKDIAAGNLRDGDALPPESELIAHFGVSTPTLRAALRILESESLITIARGTNGGARVHHPDLEASARPMELLLHMRGTPLRDFFCARALVEPEAAYLFAELQPAAGFEALQSILAAEEAVLDDQLEWATPHVQYYRVITDHCGNDVLAVFGAALQHLLVKAAVVNLKRIWADPRLVGEKAIINREHQEMFAILKSGNPVRARRFWKRHIESIMERNPDFMELQFNAFD